MSEYMYWYNFTNTRTISADAEKIVPKIQLIEDRYQHYKNKFSLRRRHAYNFVYKNVLCYLCLIFNLTKRTKMNDSHHTFTPIGSGPCMAPNYIR